MIRDMEAIRVADYKLHKRGHRGYAVTIPRMWVEDMALQPGDRVEMYREGRKLILAVKGADNDAE